MLGADERHAARAPEPPPVDVALEETLRLAGRPRVVRDRRVVDDGEGRGERGVVAKDLPVEEEVRIPSRNELEEERDAVVEPHDTRVTEEPSLRQRILPVVGVEVAVEARAGEER